MKRTNQLIVLLSDDELARLERLVESHRLTGDNASKSSVVRRALFTLPVQSPLPFSSPGIVNGL